jgi:hypothetical protein
MKYAEKINLSHIFAGTTENAITEKMEQYYNFGKGSGDDGSFKADAQLAEKYKALIDSQVLGY